MAKFLEIEIISIRTFVAIVSLFGCIWQSVDISNIYFSYDTNVNVRFEHEVPVQVPGVTICANVRPMIREDYMIKRYPQLVDILKENQTNKQRQLNKFLKNLTLAEQLNEATVGHRQVFNSCLIMTPMALEDEKRGGGYLNCSEVVSIREYLTYYKKCFFIASQLHDEPVDRYKVNHDTGLQDNGFPLFQIKLNNQYLDQVVIFINSRTTPFLGFMGGQTNGIHLNNTKYASYTLSYVKTTTKLLEPPYKTNCRDYRSVGYRTLAHCIIKCKANYFVDHFSGWHPDIPADNDDNLAVRYAEVRLKENKTLDEVISGQCRRVCTKMADCESEYYTTTIIGQFDRDPVRYPQYNPLHGIFIYLPSGLNTHYVHSPRLQGVEYICYFASVVSLWFGFSIITISEALVKACELYQDHKDSNKKRKDEVTKDAKDKAKDNVTKDAKDKAKDNATKGAENKAFEMQEPDTLATECARLKVHYDRWQADVAEQLAQFDQKLAKLEQLKNN